MSLTMMMWNVEHGSAILIHTPNGKRLIIDLGASDQVSPLLGMSKAGMTADHVTITHPHMDHIDDILNFDLLAPKVLSAPRGLTEADIRGGNPRLSSEAERKIQKYFEIRNGYNGVVSPLDDVTLLQNNGGVSIQIFAPNKPSSNLNNYSIVTTVEYSGVKILIPGDNESQSWEELLGRQDFRSAVAGTHVLVAAHHGRESGFYRPLFDYFNPCITLISDGRAVGTSVTGRYDDVTSGWTVYHHNRPAQVRKCITTRNDGNIQVEVTPGTPTGYLKVSTT